LLLLLLGLSHYFFNAERAWRYSISAEWSWAARRRWELEAEEGRQLLAS